MTTPVIRTPDQRVRVFISSTLGELAPERTAVRDAVERLRLLPVMFESGARPHPPRQLYRAYLAQSHVFVGIYWQRYGWVAPGEEVSGLEDEFQLAGRRPRLLYIKEPAPEREPRLTGLIREFQADDSASYKRFSSTEELTRLVSEDLAVLLTERFMAAESDPGEQPAAAANVAPSVAANLAAWTPPPAALPSALTSTVGRRDDLRLLADWIHAGSRLITVTGPGGVGKTRLVAELGRMLRESAGDRYPGEVHFVALETVREPQLALRTIADRLGARAEGTRPAAEVLADHLDGHRSLLILDNLEQVVELGVALTGLLARLPELQLLTTSRQLLRVRGEREFRLRPLPLPAPGTDLARLREEPAVRLFAERAAATAPEFDVTEQNAAAVVELCHRLDGLPLAIELAAARTRLLPPAQLLARLDRSGGVLAGGPADAPERHRTLRATLEWSYQLLTEAEQALLARLSGFAGGFTLSAAEAVCGPLGTPDVLATVASLLDKSLLVVEEWETEEPRLRMLQTVRAYAAEQLAHRGETEVVRTAHLAYFREFADRAQPHLCGPGQREWAQRFDPERANVRLAAATALERGDDVAVIELVWDVYVYYWIRDAVAEPESWMRAVVVAGRPLDPVATAKLECLWALSQIARGDYDDAGTRLDAALAVFRAHQMDFEAAVALKEIANVAYVVDSDPPAAVAALRESSQLFEAVCHDWGVALVETMLGTVLAVTGDLTGAEEHHRRALQRAGRIGNEQIMVQALHQLALVRVLQGRSGEAAAFLAEAVPLVRTGRLQNAATYCLDVIAAVALDRDDPATAAEALAVAERVRQRLRTPVWPTVRAVVDDLSRRVAAVSGTPAGVAGPDLGGAGPGGERGEGADGDVFATVDRGLAAVR